MMAVREAHGKNASPTVVIADSQSVKTTEVGGPSGYDAGKKVKGRKRHIAVDTLGLPVKCTVTTADVQDRDALPALLSAVSKRAPWVKRSDKEIKGFIVLPKRWIVERTFGWINRARRLSKDFEALIESSQAWFLVAIAFLLVRRIARDYTAAA